MRRPRRRRSRQRRARRSRASRISTSRRSRPPIVRSSGRRQMTRSLLLRDRRRLAPYGRCRAQRRTPARRPARTPAMATATSAQPISPSSCWASPATRSRRWRRAVMQILGAASEIPATTDPTFSVQQQMRTLTGTAQNDIIYAANPNRMPSGTTERLIDVMSRFRMRASRAKTATITNLPAGYAIENGVQSGSNWTVQLDPLDPSHLQLELRYVLPTSATQPDANGFLGSFNLNILFGTVGCERGNPTVFRQPDLRHPRRHQRSRRRDRFGGRQIDDLRAQCHAAGREHLGRRRRRSGLCRSGPRRSRRRHRQQHALLQIFQRGRHGGSLHRSVRMAVMPKATPSQNFTNIEGSAFADKLTGTAGDNTFYGSGGGDIIIGNGGIDTVDYSSSTTGVSVNLTTGIGSGGLAARRHADRHQQSDRLGHRQQHADRQQRRQRHHRRRRKRRHRWRRRCRYADRRRWRRHHYLSWCPKFRSTAAPGTNTLALGAAVTSTSPMPIRPPATSSTSRISRTSMPRR